MKEQELCADELFDIHIKDSYESLIFKVMNKILRYEIKTQSCPDDVRIMKIPFGDVAVSFDVVRYGIYSKMLLNDLDVFHIGVACRKFDDTLYVIWGNRKIKSIKNSQYDLCQIVKKDMFFNRTFDELVEDSNQALE